MINAASSHPACEDDDEDEYDDDDENEASPARAEA